MLTGVTFNTPVARPSTTPRGRSPSFCYAIDKYEFTFRNAEIRVIPPWTPLF